MNRQIATTLGLLAASAPLASTALLSQAAEPAFPAIDGLSSRLPLIMLHTP